MFSFGPLRSALHYALALCPEANLCRCPPCLGKVPKWNRELSKWEVGRRDGRRDGWEVMMLFQFFSRWFATGGLCPVTEGQLQAALFLCYSLQRPVNTLCTCPFRPWVVTFSAVANLGVLYYSFLVSMNLAYIFLFSLFIMTFSSPSLSMPSLTCQDFIENGAIKQDRECG